MDFRHISGTLSSRVGSEMVGGGDYFAVHALEMGEQIGAPHTAEGRTNVPNAKGVCECYWY